MLTYGSLFSGAGGFDLGLDAAGMRCAWQVEIDHQARSVLRNGWPDVPKHEDVRYVGAETVSSSVPISRRGRRQSVHKQPNSGAPTSGRAILGPVDLICGGFPCQDLSVAGRRAGLAGERSGLFHEFMRIVDEIAPTWVLIENVPGLLSSNGGRDMGTVLGALGDLGYGWTYRVLDAQHFGVPQRRRRVFIVGHSGGVCPPEVLFEPESVRGDSPQGREAGEGSTRGAGDGAAYQATGDGYFRAGRGPLAVSDDNGTNQLAIAHTLRAEGFDASEDGTGRGTPLVPALPPAIGLDPQLNVPVELIGALNTGSVSGGGQPARVLAFHPTQDPISDPERSPALGSTSGGMGVWALGSHAGAAGGDVSNQNHSKGGPTSMGISEEMAHSLRGGRTQSIVAAIPRRLTPVECERLMGWPDDHTRYGITDEGKQVEMADGPRYRMCGNGVAAPVAEWIARRIVAHAAAQHSTRQAA